MQALINRLWAKLLLTELARLGVVNVCIAPGSRSTPLTLAATYNESFSIHTHFDERGLGFYALGLAKTSNLPVVVIVTSGTAVANLLPAVVEASLRGEKLVILSADRPVELINCGANQAIDQINIFGLFADKLNLPSPSLNISPKWLLCAVDNLLHNQKLNGGAVHINCPYPEPLYLEYDELANEKTFEQQHLAKLSQWQKTNIPYTCYTDYPNTQANVNSEVENLINKKVLIVLANVSKSVANRATDLANKLDCPIFIDIQAGGSKPDLLYYDLCLHIDKFHELLMQSEVVLQFGGEIVSKRLNNFIQQAVLQSAEYWLIDPRKKIINPNHLPQKYFQVDCAIWLEKQLNNICENKPLQNASNKKWLNELIKYNEIASSVINEQTKKNVDEINEYSLVVNLAEMAKSVDVFIGNSLIIRLADMFTKFMGGEVYSNRGASGIDGLIASACGVQYARQKPMIVLVGDVSLLHDINSLALATKTPAPLVIIVTNNNGGAIFDFLPVPKREKVKYYQMPHNLNFVGASDQFNINYQNPQSLNQLKIMVNQHLTCGSNSLLIEISCEPNRAFSDIQNLSAKLQKLNS